MKALKDIIQKKKKQLHKALDNWNSHKQEKGGGEREKIMAIN